jgi:hypothetical protein
VVDKCLTELAYKVTLISISFYLTWCDASLTFKNVFLFEVI